MNKNKAKIFVVEDEQPIREGLCDLLTYHGYEVESEENGKVALDKILSNSYHLILLDVMLPDLDGFSICEKVREKDRSLPIIMLTAKGDEEDIVKGLKLGADDYIGKPFAIKELIARIDSVLRRSSRFITDQKTIQLGNLIIDPLNLTLTKENQEVELLTRKEVDIINYLLSHKERPIPRHELLKEVWGYSSSNMDTRTVDIHMAKLRKKIEDDSQNPTYIITVRGEGYRIGIE
jgi:two-component system response regulator RegX3